MSRLDAAGYRVLLETGGSESIGLVPKSVHIIMDIKCPGSRMENRNLWSNLDHLKPSDEIKFVLADLKDYQWARSVIADYRLDERCQLLLSCAFGLLEPKAVVEWMIRD